MRIEQLIILYIRLAYYTQSLIIEAFKKMKPQAMNIIKMVAKPINERMPFQGVELTKFVQKLPFFKRFFPYQSQKFISLCLSSFLIEFGAGEDFYSKQADSDLIYIIIEGEVLVASKLSKIKRKIMAYDLLGHVEVVFGMSERGQTAKAVAKTYCMGIKAENFKNVWQKQDQIQKSYKYLISNKYFEGLSQFDKKYLSLLMIKGSFTEHQTISAPGSINQKVFFIIYGQAYVLKKLKVGGVEKQVIIESLYEMDRFGQYESLNKLISEVTLKGASSGSFYCINVSEAILINHPFIDLLRNTGLPYPEREELQFRFSVQSKVQKYKQKVKKKLCLY